MYTVPAWVLNSIYSRIRPAGVVSTLLFGLALKLSRAACSCVQRGLPGSALTMQEAILFLHGIPTRGCLWNGVVERLGGQFRCIAVDLPPEGFRI